MVLRCPKQSFVNFVSRCSSGGLSGGCKVMHPSQKVRCGASRAMRGSNEYRNFQHCRLERHSFHDCLPTMLKISLHVRLRQVNASGVNWDVMWSKISLGRSKSRMPWLGPFLAGRYERWTFWLASWPYPLLQFHPALLFPELFFLWVWLVGTTPLVSLAGTALPRVVLLLRLSTMIEGERNVKVKLQYSDPVW
jgi:hypothetical protein